MTNMRFQMEPQRSCAGYMMRSVYMMQSVKSQPSRSWRLPSCVSHRLADMPSS